MGPGPYDDRLTIHRPSPRCHLCEFFSDVVSGNALTPEFLWAQRKDSVLITINLPNVDKANSKIDVRDDGHLFFSGRSGTGSKAEEYVLDIELFKPIKASESKYGVTARNIRFTLVKAESGPYWDRLLKQEGRNVHCKIDWDHWKDPDDEEYAFTDSFGGNKDLQDMDFVSGASTPDDDEDDEEEPVDISSSST